MREPTGSPKTDPAVAPTIGIPRHGPDSVHSWITAGACALATFFGVGGRRSAGFLYIAILDTFKATRSQAAWPVILMGGVLLLAGLISGPLAHRFTARPVAIVGGFIAALGFMLCYFATSIYYLVFSLGIVHAIGSGMVFVVIPTVINEHFVKYKGLAMGINFAGSTMGTFVFPKLLELLTESYGFRGALLIFGAVTLNSIAFSLFLRQPPWLKTHRKQEALRSVQGPPSLSSTISKSLDPQSIGNKGPVPKCAPEPGSFRHGLTVFSSPMFYVIMYSFIVFSFAFECYISLLVDFATDRGVGVSSAVTMLSVSSMADLTGRLALPALADRGLFSRQQLMTVSLWMMGTLYLSLPFSHGYSFIFVVATGIAFTIGTSVVLFSVLLAEYLGVERVSMAYGMVAAAAGMTSFGKPFIIGHFRDVVGEYDILFRICGGVVLLGGLMWVVVLMADRSKSSKKWTLKQRDAKDNMTVIQVLEKPEKCDR